MCTSPVMNKRPFLRPLQPPAFITPPVTPTAACVTDLHMYNKLLGIADTVEIDQAQGQACRNLKSPAAQGRAIYMPQAAADIAANRVLQTGMQCLAVVWFQMLWLV